MKKSYDCGTFFCRGIRRTLIVTAIGLGATIVGLIAYIVRISMSYQKLQSNQESLLKNQESLKLDNQESKRAIATLQIIVDNNSKRDEEERVKNAKKFDDLFISRNKTNEAITELTTTIKMMVNNMDSQFKSLDKKIDELKRG